MQIFNGHYNVANLIDVNRVTKDEILDLAVEGRVPIAVWADNVFVWPVYYSQQDKGYRKMATHSRLCNGEWFYVRRRDLREQKFKRLPSEVVARHRDYEKSAYLRLLRSGPETSVDTRVSRSGLPGASGALRISLDDLWVPTDSWHLIEEEVRKESENPDAFNIARRVYTDILAAHDKNRAFAHPGNCSDGRVYLHLARQAAPPAKNAEYWVNDPKRDSDKVGRKVGLGTLAIHYRPEGTKRPTHSIAVSYREFMNAFKIIKRQ